MSLLLDIVLLPLIFFIGLVTSYEDIKYGKIRNKWIVLGLGWGLVVFLLCFIWYFIASPVTKLYYSEVMRLPTDSFGPIYTFNLSFLLESLLNFLSAVVAGFALWRFNSWAAGDAKLFIVYSLLIPLFHYQRSYMPVFPSFVLLVNIFCIFLVYLSISIFFHLSVFVYKRLRYYWAISFNSLEKKQDQNFIRSLNWLVIIKKIKDLAVVLVLPVFILLLSGFFREPIKQYLFIDLIVWQPFIFATLIIFNKIMMGVAKQRWLVRLLFLASLFICGYGLMTDYPQALMKIYIVIKSILVFMILFALFQGLVNLYFKKNQYQEIKIKDLKAGMIVEPSLLKEHGIPEGESPGIISLNEEQTEKIKSSFLAKKMEKVNVLKSSSFAIWVFVGALVTLVLEKSLVNIFLGLINR